jgi:hypothetical protein
MGGRSKVYTGLDALAAKPTVRRWLDGLTEGHSRRHGLYGINKYVIWRRAKGLETDPERWVEECMEGTQKTLVAHLLALQDYARSGEFDGDANETRRKNYFRIRGFYAANLVPLPEVRLKLPNPQAHGVKRPTTATSARAHLPLPTTLT